MRFDEDANPGPLNPSAPYDLLHFMFAASEPMLMSLFRQDDESFKVSETVVADANDLPGVRVLSGMFNGAC